MNKLLLLVLLIGFKCAAQLPAFTVSATSTPQTCLGNGALNFTVSGTNPSAVMAYEVYLLPNTTTAVATVNNPSAANLIAGNYQVVATQTIGANSNTATTTVTIANLYVPLVYTLSTSLAQCGTAGTITVNVAEGVAVSYEIMSGPQTAPSQSSNVFTGLPMGQYQVRVYDNCGDAVVVTVQLAQTPSNIFVEPVITPAQQIDCDTVKVTNFYYAFNGSIQWPLTFTYVIYPPGGGAPVTVTSTVQTGNEYNFIETQIPFYPSQYYYNLTITDACGQNHVRNYNTVNLPMAWELKSEYDPCYPDEILLQGLTNVTYPVTVSFVSAPAGFNPLDLNASHPTFNFGENISYKIEGSTIPVGLYTVLLTDACGRSSQKTVEAGAYNDAFLLQTIPGNCGFGGIKLCMGGKACTIKEFTSGPPEFSSTYPIDVGGQLLLNGDIDLTNLLPGTYTLHVIDECGLEHTQQFTITGSSAAVPSSSVRPGCAQGQGSILISASEQMTSVIIQDAPDAFTGTIPYDASANINASGNFLMNSLPEGSYTFTVSNSCGNFTVQRNIVSEVVLVHQFSITPLCGSFNIFLQHMTNGDEGSFWLQKYDEVSNTWGHPMTGVNYPEGAQPNMFNSVSINNFGNTFNLSYTGQFRVVKATFVYGNGNSTGFFVPCISVIEEFDFDGGPQITDAFSFPCDDGTAEVVLVATGVPPFNYAITTKNGQPFSIDNGDSPHFESLEPAIYNFQVADDCGNIRNIVFDINTLETPAIQPQGFCNGQDSALQLPEFDFLVYEWWKEGEPGTILSTASGLLFPAFNNDTDGGVYVAHITSINPGSCIDLMLTFNVVPVGTPNAGEDNTAVICSNSGVVNLNDHLSEIHDTGGVWQQVTGTATLIGSNISTTGLAPGSYVFSYTVTQCENTDTALLTLEIVDTPVPPTVAGIGTVCSGTDIYLFVMAAPGVTYQWTGPNDFSSDQQSPVIVEAGVSDAGTYSVTATLNGCSSLATEIVIDILPSPEFVVEGATEICEGQSTTLSLMPVNYNDADASFTWFYNGDLQADLTTSTIEVLETGTFTVMVQHGGCTTERTIEISEDTDAFPVQAWNGCVEDAYILSVLNLAELEGSSFAWTGPDGYSATGPQVDISRLAIGEYTVTVTNEEGCNVEVSMIVENTSCAIPRGVSPNGDGLNDTFDLTGLGVDEIQIFNRSGLRVYKHTYYSKEWYGQSYRGDLPTGTYYYVLKFNDGKNKTGWVYLQRED